jgi:hypothetical protein
MSRVRVHMSPVCVPTSHVCGEIGTLSAQFRGLLPGIVYAEGGGLSPSLEGWGAARDTGRRGMAG